MKRLDRALGFKPPVSLLSVYHYLIFHFNNYVFNFVPNKYGSGIRRSLVTSETIFLTKPNQNNFSPLTVVVVAIA